MTPGVPEDRRPVDLERRRQLVHRDTLTVGGEQLGNLGRAQPALDRKSGDKGVGRMDGRLTGALPQYRPERWQIERMAI